MKLKTAAEGKRNKGTGRRSSSPVVDLNYSDGGVAPPRSAMAVYRPGPRRAPNTIAHFPALARSPAICVAAVTVAGE